MQTQTNEQNASETIPEETEAESTSAQEGAPDSAGDESGDDGGIEIDGQRFASETEALAFAKSQLSAKETKLAVAEAYQAGLLESRGAPAAPAAQAEEPEDPNWEERFYSNPKAALKEAEERAARKALSTIQRTNAAQDEERRIWGKFADLHPDLADFRNDIELTANSPEHIEKIKALALSRGEEAAMDYVAQKTRAKFQAYAQAAKTKTVLPRGNGAGATPAGAAKSVTPPKKTEKPLSMSEQLRQIKQKQR